MYVCNNISLGMYAIILLLGLHFLNICFSDQNAQDNQRLLKGVIFNIFVWKYRMLQTPNLILKIYIKRVETSGGRQAAMSHHYFLFRGATLAFFSSGSHEPPLFPLTYHHIWLFRAKLIFKWYIYFQKSSRVML